MPNLKKPRPDVDRLAVEAIAALEVQEPPETPVGWPYAADGGREARRRGRSWSAAALSQRAWCDMLRAAGIVRDAVSDDGRYLLGVRVPAWVNDLARAADRYGQQPGTPAYDRAVRLVRRAVRTAARAPLFRAALSVECRRLRCEESARLAPEALLRWLEERDWSDARPGAAISGGAPKGVAGTAADAGPEQERER